MSEGTLLERVEAATGADRALDDAIWRAFEPHTYLYAQQGRTWSVNRVGTALTPVWEYCADPRPTYTISLDATLALVERVLPGWDWTISGGNGPLGWAQLKRWDIVHSNVGNSPALALLAALLRATEEKPQP